MKATYQNHVIEPIKRGGDWYTLIDGVESGVKPARYRGWAVNWAMRLIDEREQAKRFTVLKEAGL